MQHPCIAAKSAPCARYRWSESLLGLDSEFGFEFEFVGPRVGGSGRRVVSVAARAFFISGQAAVSGAAAIDGSRWEPGYRTRAEYGGGSGTWGG